MKKIFLLIALLTVAQAHAGLFGFGRDDWKEEVLLHDGSKMIVKRSQLFGGRHELGQSPPIKEHSITFTLLGSSKPITWKSEFSEDIGHSNFDLLALDIVNGTAYVVAYPTGCFYYNKWGRPNPPYVFFEFVKDSWKKIALSELPTEISQPNLAINTYGHADIDQAVESGFISADSVKQFNSTLTQVELKSIVRIPIKKAGVDCGERVFYKGSWIMPNDPIAKTILDRRKK